MLQQLKGDKSPTVDIDKKKKINIFQ